jgi:hypothetical protein
VASTCHILRPDLSWLTECGRENRMLNADKTDIERRWCKKCVLGHKTRPASSLNPACPKCQDPMGKVRGAMGRSAQACVRCDRVDKEELTAVVPKGTSDIQKDLGRIRSRGVDGKEYVLHVQAKLGITLCSKISKDVNCYPLLADRRQCILENQCCKQCARIVSNPRSCQVVHTNDRVKAVIRVGHFLYTKSPYRQKHKMGQWLKRALQALWGDDMQLEMVEGVPISRGDDRRAKWCVVSTKPEWSRSDAVFSVSLLRDGRAEFKLNPWGSDEIRQLRKYMILSRTEALGKSNVLERL